MDLQDCDSHCDILKQADVVQDLAENGAIVILIDEVNLHTSKANVVWHALICEQLRRDRRQTPQLEASFACLFFKVKKASVLS